MPSGEPVSTTFAPSDYTDNRSKGEWAGRYPCAAYCFILFEFVCTLFWSVVSLFLIFMVLYSSHLKAEIGKPILCVYDWLFLVFSEKNDFSGALCALIGGFFGGTLFDLKWFYHSIAKHIWNVDRIWWRLLVPYLSGTMALVFYFVLARANSDSFIAILSYSCLVGMFSDKALAKLTEIADKFFETPAGARSSKNAS